MKIRFNPVNYNFYKPSRFPRLKPLSYDSISFGAMKKSQFQGTDLAVINKFQAPIEKFNSHDDFDRWCLDEINKIKKTKYQGRDTDTLWQRREVLQEWFDYLQNQNKEYGNAINLLILNGITRNLKANNDNLPPVLNKRALADTIYEIKCQTENNPKIQINFVKEYQLNLQEQYFNISHDEAVNNNYTGWIVIPSKENDPDNFEDNVAKLKTLSCDSWCTKSYNAEPYLTQGDFHIYFENGKPKLGIRFYNNLIKEIQGEKNNSKIPIRYFDTAMEHMDEYSIGIDAKKEIDDAQDTIKIIENYKKQIAPKTFTDLKPKEIFELFGIEAQEDENGLLTVEKYNQPCEKYTFSDLGIDENELFKSIKAIKGNAFFYNSDLIRFDNLKEIGGNASFCDSRVTHLGSLETIKGYANFNSSNVVDLGHLKTIGKDACFSSSKDINTGDLEVIGGNANFTCSQIKDLGKLRCIKGNAKFWESKIKSLKKVEYIGGNAEFQYSNIEDLGELKIIGGNAEFRRSMIKELKNLEEIGGNALFCSSDIESLYKLKRIGGDAHFEYSNVKDYGALTEIGKDAYFSKYKRISPKIFECTKGRVYLNDLEMKTP